MNEKEKLVINCTLCDATKIREEDYACFGSIELNTEILLVDDRSRSILNRLPVQMMNASSTSEKQSQEEWHFLTINSNYKIEASTQVEKGTILVVNGSLTVAPGSGGVLENYKALIVNGDLQCPGSLGGKQEVITCNGTVFSYPDECILLENKFIMDPSFPQRAAENGQYYAAKGVVITDKGIDTALLAQKRVRFVTREMIVSEEMAGDALSLVEETVKVIVVPEGYAYVPGNVELTEELLIKYGTKLFIRGNLSVKEKAVSLLSGLEGLVVIGKVSLHESGREAFRRLNVRCGKLELKRGRVIDNVCEISLDAAALEEEPEGIRINNAARVRLSADIPPELIKERLEIGNASRVFCAREQETAVHMICRNVSHICSDGDAALNEGKRDRDTPDAGFVRVINGGVYIL